MVYAVPVFARFGKSFVVVALVLTTGLHWVTLQSVAWTTMLANNLRTQSVSEAVMHTFDGKHPCCLCKAIAAGKKSENKSEGRQGLQKFDLFADGSAGFYFPPSSKPQFFRLPLMTGRLETPPLPPPRTIPG